MSFFCLPPEDVFFEGRPDDPRLGLWVKSKLGGLPPVEAFQNKKQIFIMMGCPDDEGVHRNRGRPGAKHGPDAIRRAFYKMTPPMDQDWSEILDLWDFGNIVTENQDIEVNHFRAQQVAQMVGESSGILIALGGGHDFSAPLIQGFSEGFRRKKGMSKRLGIINIDPHLDMRPLSDHGPHSGTPFRELLEKKIVQGKYLVCFGTRPNRNARAHYEFARLNKVRIRTWESIMGAKDEVSKIFSKELQRLTKLVDIVAISLDLDSCHEAEGTSAAPVLGFSTWNLCQFAYECGREKKVRYLELAEAAPTLDHHERIARIAAEILYFFLRGRADVLSR